MEPYRQMKINCYQQKKDCFIYEMFYVNLMVTGKQKSRAEHKSLKKGETGASLVAQWLRICLPMQGTRVRALVWEDPTCRGATGPVSHSY